LTSNDISLLISVLDSKCKGVINYNKFLKKVCSTLCYTLHYCTIAECLLQTVAVVIAHSDDDVTALFDMFAGV
jgi:hypothetical protein